MICYTSVLINYIPKARILAKSIKRQNPEWKFILLVSEPLPDGIIDPNNEPFDDIVTIHKLDLGNTLSWIFKHRVVEICTAVKGVAAAYIMDNYQTDKLIYLDPDTVAFSSLRPIEKLLDQYPIILTPHQLVPDQEIEAIVDNEICSMKHGIFNLGFFAARNEGQGREFIDYYHKRLFHFCYDDIPNGLFTDQKWCDLAIAFFSDLYVLRDPGYNVASWNLTHRKLSCDASGNFLVNSSPLRFYHFTGYDSGTGAIMTKKYGDQNRIVHELWDWYEGELSRSGQDTLGSWSWKYNEFYNGEKILDEMRFLYRHRIDLQNYFSNPFDTSKDGGYLAWWTDAKQKGEIA